MTRYLAILLLAVCTPWLIADTTADAFKWQWSLSPHDHGQYTLSVNCNTAEKAYLYAEATTVQANFADGSNQVITPLMPPVIYNDEAIYPAGTNQWQAVLLQKPSKIQIDFQGCIGEMCLMPETIEFDIDPPSANPSNTPPNSVENSASSSLIQTLDGYTLLTKSSGLLTESELCSFIQSASHSTPAVGDYSMTAANAPEAPAGFWAVFLLVILGGLGLNLTPCVLPMIPVNLAIIGASGGAGSRFQGFRRGLAYALGITLAYGVLGLLAAFTGNTFGSLNSSSIFNLVIALLFAALSLGMLGVYELDLARLGNLFKRNTGNKKSWQLPPEITALGMGAVAALLAGACVAPVVITVLVLTAQLWSSGNYWALGLPFALGMAMALPWPLLGAGLSFLPRPGAWMVKIKMVFGIIIMLMALYYGFQAWILRNGGFSQSTAVKEFISQLEETPPGKIILVDCWATWCKNCTALEDVLASDKVREQLDQAQIRVIRFQTQQLNDPEIKEFMQKYDLPGLPSLLLLQKDN